MTVPGESSSQNAEPRPDRGWRPVRTALYRFYGADGELLYVGITNRLQKRWREHSRHYAATWWPKVRSNTVHWYPNRTEAGRAEREAIRTEKPLYNVMHTGRHNVPIRTRANPESQTEQRGDVLLDVLKKHFAHQPFTAADVVGIACSSPSGVQKNMNALVIRGLVMIVGARHALTSGRGRRSSTLYAFPVSEWVDGENGAPLDPDRIPADPPKPRRKLLPVPKQRSNPLAASPRLVRLDQPEPEVDSALPAVVTFTSGAALLEQLGLVTSITREGVRFISKKERDWPFGPGKPHAYGKAGSAVTMDTQVFLDYFRSGPRRGGTGRKPSPLFSLSDQAAVRRQAQ
jgi:predicted GIY-YIG superfamily endonuclease